MGGAVSVKALAFRWSPPGPCAPVLALATCLALVAAARADAPRGPREQLRVDGVTITFERARLTGDLPQLLRAHATAWAQENPSEPIVRSRSGAWEIVGQRHGRDFRTAQFLEGPAGVVAAYAWREWNATPVRVELPLRLPRVVRIVRTFETVAESPVVLDVVADADVAAPELRRLLERDAQIAGWRLDPAVRGDAGAPNATTLVWSRGADELMAVIGSSNRKSTLLLHAVSRVPAKGARR